MILGLNSLPEPEFASNFVCDLAPLIRAGVYSTDAIYDSGKGVLH